nr:hypothetical protein [uncultured bacterium]
MLAKRVGVDDLAKYRSNPAVSITLLMMVPNGSSTTFRTPTAAARWYASPNSSFVPLPNHCSTVEQTNSTFGCTGTCSFRPVERSSTTRIESP